MYCKNCGTKVETGAVYCPKCGTKLEKEISSKSEENLTFSHDEIIRRDNSTVMWLIILCLLGFLVFLFGILLTGLSIWLFAFLFFWILSLVMTFTSFKHLPITQKDADEHDEKIRRKVAPKEPSDVQLIGDISKINTGSRYGLWASKQKGFKKFLVLFLFIAGTIFGVMGGLLPILGVGGYAAKPNGVYVQDKKISGQEGLSAYKFEKDVFYYTDDYHYSSTIWGPARVYTYKAGRVTYKYVIHWGSENVNQNVSGTIYVTNFGQTLSGNFFGIGGTTYSKD